MRKQNVGKISMNWIVTLWGSRYGSGSRVWGLSGSRIRSWSSSGNDIKAASGSGVWHGYGSGSGVRE